MKKLISLILLVFLLTSNVVFAKSGKFNLKGMLKSYGVNEGAVSISIKSVNGNQSYSHNDNMLLSPASVQKLLIMPAVYENLGADYKFRTGLYKRDDVSYVLKLGADPYLTSSDLKILMKGAGVDIKNLYIDDKILDNKTWGEGWQWDDELNTLMPRFGAYNLDKNLLKINLSKNADNSGVNIVNKTGYPLVLYNNLQISDKTKINVVKDENAASSNIYTLNGTLARTTNIYIPVNNLKNYFNIKLTAILESQKKYLKQPFGYTDLKNEDVLQNEITHSFEKALVEILHNSNNLMAETVFKLAGRNYAGVQSGTDVAAIEMFKNYCEKNKLDYSNIRIVDGSGVSTNNLVSTDFITDFLIVNKDNPVIKYLPTSGEGTLATRLQVLNGKLYAKTGTLSNISSIAGYITTAKNNKYVFSIITNDVKLSNSDKKMFEDYILKEIYMKL